MGKNKELVTGPVKVKSLESHVKLQAAYSLLT